MRTEYLFLTDEEVEINEDAVIDTATETELNEQGYDELAVTTDNRIIGFDYGCNGWVELA